MGRNTSVILGEHFDEFIKSEIDSGRYNSVSEIIRSGLRMLEDESKKIKLINEALVVGEESGKARVFDNENFKRKMKKKMGVDA
jgi:antitoxin ParD1/3/4